MLNHLLVFLFLFVLIINPLAFGEVSEQGIFEREINVRLDAEASAYEYEIELTTIKDGNRYTEKFKTKETIWVKKLAVGHYELRIRSRDKRQAPGPWGLSLIHI